ncbi:MAG: hypothetical protein N2449_06350 [Bacteroidales bacterium]|nr:hypothetical protein [Bacteroidales bacterium]
MHNFSLLQQLCSIHAPSGEEYRVFDFVQQWLKLNDPHAIIDRDSLYNAMFIKKGFSSVAFLVHVDTVGFIKQYKQKVLPIGSPDIANYANVKTSSGKIYRVFSAGETYQIDDYQQTNTGTTFTYETKLNVNSNYIQGTYLDNRLHVTIALETIANSENCLFVFTSNEEISGGCTEKVARILYESYHINKTIILDTTFASEGILLDKGVVLSLKDEYLPSRPWVDEIHQLLYKTKIPFQIEVADFGSSDGAYISKSPYPIQWCFLGIACQNYHSPDEKVSLYDVNLMEKTVNLLIMQNTNLKFI